MFKSIAFFFRFLNVVRHKIQCWRRRWLVMIQKCQWTIIHPSYSLLREVDCSCLSEESLLKSVVRQMNIHKNPGNSQSLFVIPTLARWHSQMHPMFPPALWRVSKLIPIIPIILLYTSSDIPGTSVAVVSNPSYSEGQPECPPMVWYSPDIDASKFTL